MMVKREIEERFIAAVVKDDTGERLAECRRLPTEAFETPACSRAWQTLQESPDLATGLLHADVRRFFAHTTLGSEYTSDRAEVFIGWLRRLGLEAVDIWRSSLPSPNGDRLRARIDARCFNFTSPPPEPVPRFLINGRAVCTPGNQTNLIAQAKVGKSALIGAMLAASICAECKDSEHDTLGVAATAPGALQLVHFDTEQSRFDHDAHIRRALRRAGVDAPPPWLRSYGLAGFSANDLREALRLALADAMKAGGVFAVIIDGTADLVNDVNDAEECNAFVAELHDLAIRYDCPIVNVVHENPGQDGGKMRGHLGSQLERKAESNLRLRKTDEVTVVFSEKMRRAPILEKDGPRFRWDDVAGMHVTCESLGATRDDAKRERLKDQAEAVFIAADKQALTWSELREGIGKSEGIGQSGAGKRFDAMKALGVIKKDMIGLWRIAA